MSKNTSSSASGGIGCTGFFAILLTVLFIGLKLTNQIDWGWIWVLSPIWIYALFALVILILVVVALIIAAIVSQ